MDIHFRGRTAIVTGAVRGIGRRIAHDLASGAPHDPALRARLHHVDGQQAPAVGEDAQASGCALVAEVAGRRVVVDVGEVLVGVGGREGRVELGEMRRVVHVAGLEEGEDRVGDLQRDEELLLLLDAHVVEAGGAHVLLLGRGGERSEARDQREGGEQRTQRHAEGLHWGGGAAHGRWSYG